MKLPRRNFLHLAASAAALSGVSRIARAQDYPSRPVRIIVNLAPGGGLDFNSRLIGEFVSRSLGQQVIVENKPGAGGMIGIEAAAKSAPDGYTILTTTDVITSGPHVTATNTDFVKDLVPVIRLTAGPLVLAVHPSLGVSSIAELVALSKQRSGLSYATSGAGTQQHFIGEWFAKLAMIKLEHVPYRGAGQAIHAHRQKEAWPARHPALAIARNPAARHDHVHVRVMGQCRAPGVQHGGNADSGAEMFGIGCDCQHGLGRDLE